MRRAKEKMKKMKNAEGAKLIRILMWRDWVGGTALRTSFFPHFIATEMLMEEPKCCTKDKVVNGKTFS